jgi:hypothetical protein
VSYFDQCENLTDYIAVIRTLLADAGLTEEAVPFDPWIIDDLASYIADGEGTEITRDQIVTAYDFALYRKEAANL